MQNNQEYLWEVRFRISTTTLNTNLCKGNTIKYENFLSNSFTYTHRENDEYRANLSSYEMLHHIHKPSVK